MKKLTILQLSALAGTILIVIIGAVVYNQKFIQHSTQEQATSLKQLLQTTTPRICTFNSTQSDAQSSGTVFVANGMLRGDFVSTINNQSVNSHLIVKDNTSYVWTDQLQEGVKVSMHQLDNKNPEDQPINLDEKMKYDCQTWTQEEKIFALPEEIEFQDFSTILESLNKPKTNTQSSGTTDACNSCDQVPENARQQCRKALGCQ